MKTITIITIIALSFLLMGVTAIEGCSQTSASKTGLDFSLGTGIDKLSSGKIIDLNSPFYINLKIENYDNKQKSGKICVKDNMDDVYEGVEEDCTMFNVVAAEKSEGKKSILESSESTVPGTTQMIFPLSGTYKYTGLPTMQNAKLTVSAEYSQSSTISAPSGISVPLPETENINLEQEPAPVSVSVEKSVTKRENGYEISLGIRLKKIQDAELYSPDFKDKDYINFKVEMQPQTLDCIPEGTYDKEKLNHGLLELKNTKFIRCSALVYEEEQTWPLQIKLNYGVKIKKEFPFTIKI